MDLNLRGKRVAITGASKGIGAGVAESFAREGANLHLIARGEDGLNALSARLRSDYGIDVSNHPADLKLPDAVRRVAEEINGVDILVNNAGDIPGGSLETLDEDTWRRGWELKVFGFINLTRLVYAQMKSRQTGVIINNIGAMGDRVDYDYIAGSTGNAGLIGFTRAMGSRSLENGVRVVGINPGPVETDRIVNLMKSKAKAKFNDEGRYTELMAHWPRGRAARPQEIADMAVFLASDRSSYTSGVVITIDGGLTARGGF